MQEIQKIFDEGKSLILAGSPRTLYEGQKIMPFIENLYGKENIKIVLVEISPEVTTFRNTHRRICALIRHSILFNKETEPLTTCPLDGSKLMKREGLDNPETIVVRLQQYRDRTFPIFDSLKTEVLKLKK